MRIAINARSTLLASRTGIGRYTYHLLDSLGTTDSQNEYWIYVRKNFWDTKRVLPNFFYSNFKVRTDFLGLGINRFLKQADIYHSPSPDAVTIEGPKVVVTIHDLIYKTYPQSHTQETIDMTDKHMQGVIKRADHIVCISHNTREDLHRFFEFPKENSSVVYNGVDYRKFYPLMGLERQEAQDKLLQMGIKDPFILFVGTIEPRKNLMGLLEAFANLRGKNQFKGKLVVAGMKGWMMQSIEPLINRLGIKDDVVFLGFVSDEQLRILYNLAEVFVFPSFYEGFGFPIVEAFACGAAVVTSNTSSCLEVAQEAALTVDPKNIMQLTEAMAQLIEDQKLNGEFRQKALHKSRDFSFSKTAQETLAVYRQVAEKGL